MEIPEAQRELLLRRWPVARFATLGPGGAPRLVPVVFAWHGGRLWSPIDGKPKRAGELARVRDVRRDERVSLLLDRYAADWRLLWWLRLDGRAEVRSAEPLASDPALAEAAQALRRKYPQYRSTPLFRNRPTALAIRVEAVRSWCADAAALPRE